MVYVIGAAARLAVCLCLFFTLLCAAASIRAQCVDSSQVNNFKVRNVKLKTLFGLIPKDLATRLANHRGDSYSADKASQYMNEVRQYYATDPAQQKYEQLIANKLKLSVKAGRTWLECVEPIDPSQWHTA